MAGKARKKKAGPRKPRRKKKRDELILKLRHYIRTEGVRFLEDKNITSIGIGYKVSNGKRSNKLCLQFTVASKPEESDIGLEALGSKPIPEALVVAGEEIPTDVIERKFELAFQLERTEEINQRKLRSDPLIPGVSVSHISGTAGTLGLIVFDRQSGDPCMLSNWHVLHRAAGEIGDRIVQPGLHDDNNIQFNHAGSLVRSHLGAAGDCAIARIDGRTFRREILDLDVAPSQVARPDLDDVVTKSGRTTGVTTGIVRRIDVMAAISYPGIGPMKIGGFEIGPPDNADASFEVSLAGDSGASWLVANEDGTASEILVGVHFAGETADNPDEHALACYAHAVFRKLDVALEAPGVEDVETGQGFDVNFLSTEVPIPGLSSSQRQDAFVLNGSPLIPYTHFSVCLSKGRGLARFVAWNIDGSRIRWLSRNGIRFRLDPRVNEDFQHGNELYRNNPLDRGHLARRADLTWGSLQEAQRANRESFFYTNIAPQHAAFNQSSLGGLWGRLENAVFENVDVEDLRISLLGGPVFRADDPVHRGVSIPRDYWKLVAYNDTADDSFKVRSFMLTQRPLLTDLEALELDPFRIFQVPLDKLEEETDLDFSALKTFDTFAADAEAASLEASSPAEAREVTSASGFII